MDFSDSDLYFEKARKIREMIIERAAKNGGPFASNLGAVEIIIALCEVFDFGKDKIVFDIGQQYQAYKILTGRSERFFDIGKKGGLSKYPDITESTYDHYTTGHSGTSVSAALGYAVNNNDNKSIAFLGDGALTSGEVYEGMNHAGALQQNILLIYNQNDWSIDKNVGALADGTKMEKFADSLNFEYRGIFDGHDTSLLIDELTKVKSITSPVFFHIRTIKGKGYIHSERDPATYHHLYVPFDVETGEIESNVDEWIKDTGRIIGTFSLKCVEYIQKYPKIYITTPAYLWGGLRNVIKEFPNHVIDTGICEQHCMTFSSALRLAGSKVIMSMTSFFIARCYDQIFDVCIQKIPLVVQVCLPGVRPSNCATHQGLFDMSAFRTIPNMTLLHPMGVDEYRVMLDWAVEYAQGPIFLHTATEDCKIGDIEPIEYGKSAILSEGDQLTVVPIGSMFNAADFLKKNMPNNSVEIFNPRFLIPFDYTSLFKSLKKTKRLLIIEDGIKAGGIGEGILAQIKENNIDCKTRLLTPPMEFIENLTWEEVFEYSGMTHDKIWNAAMWLLKL
ncbi:MAG: 1-deoxy-D-xylulose-5-phosphate synthase N-terminal domain-containing protein [Desulfobacteraceae bacterium]|jgi:1-deoxy-D-xylulose-5-phosphate synthase